MPYTWDTEAGQYRDASTGRFLSERVVRQDVQRVILGAQMELSAKAIAYSRGEINHLEWSEQTWGVIRGVHTASGAAAMGGIDTFRSATPEDREHTLESIRNQHAYFEKFALDVANGSVPLDTTFVNRVLMYPDAGWGTYQEQYRNQRNAFYTSVGAGRIEERWVLDPGARHCNGCPAQAARGWISIDDPGELDLQARLVGGLTPAQRRTDERRRAKGLEPLDRGGGTPPPPPVPVPRPHIITPVILPPVRPVPPTPPPVTPFRLTPAMKRTDERRRERGLPPIDRSGGAVTPTPRPPAPTPPPVAPAPAPKPKTPAGHMIAPDDIAAFVAGSKYTDILHHRTTKDVAAFITANGLDFSKNKPNTWQTAGFYTHPTSNPNFGAGEVKVVVNAKKPLHVTSEELEKYIDNLHMKPPEHTLPDGSKVAYWDTTAQKLEVIRQAMRKDGYDLVVMKDTGTVIVMADNWRIVGDARHTAPPIPMGQRRGAEVREALIEEALVNAASQHQTMRAAMEMQQARGLADAEIATIRRRFINSGRTDMMPSELSRIAELEQKSKGLREEYARRFVSRPGAPSSVDTERERLREKYIYQSSAVAGAEQWQQITMPVRGITAKQRGEWERGIEAFTRIVGEQTPATQAQTYMSPERRDGTRVNRAEYQSGNPLRAVAGNVVLPVGSDTGTIVHELTHHLEYNDEYIAQHVRDLYNTRTQGEALQYLHQVLPNRGYGPNEMTRVDAWPEEYMGRDYGENPATTKAHEVLTMMVQKIYDDPVTMARDHPEMFDWTLDLLRRHLP